MSISTQPTLSPLVCRFQLDFCNVLSVQAQAHRRSGEDADRISDLFRRSARCFFDIIGSPIGWHNTGFAIARRRRGKPNVACHAETVVRGQAGAGDVLHRFRILPASYLLRHDHFGRMQDSDIEWMDPRQCWLLIFVSHRWETPEHPDPVGRQYRALAALVTRMLDLWDALIAEEANERIRLVPRLDWHGTAQAAVLLSRLNPAGGVRRRRLR